MKFFLIIIGLIQSAGFARAETNFYNFLKENRSALVLFKILDSSLVLKKEEQVSLKNLMTPELELKLEKERLSPLPSAKDFEPKTQTNTQTVSLKQDLVKTGTALEAYGHFINTNNLGQKPQLGQLDKEYQTVKGFRLSQALLKDSFGYASRLQEKITRTEIDMTRLQNKVNKRNIVQKLAENFSGLKATKEITSILKKKCKLAELNKLTAEKKRKRNLISAYDMGMAKHHLYECLTDYEKSISKHTSYELSLSNFFEPGFETPQNLVYDIPIFARKGAPTKNVPLIEKELWGLKHKKSKQVEKRLENLTNYDLSFNLEHNILSEGSKLSANHNDKASATKLGLYLTISLGESSSKQNLRVARIQKLITENENIYEKASLKRKIFDLKNQISILATNLDLGQKQLGSIKALYAKGLRKYKNGTISYDQLIKLSDAYFEMEIKLELEKADIFNHKVHLNGLINNHQDLI